MPRFQGRSPARVLIITTHYHPVVGGVETHARDLARGLRAAGRRVVVLTTRNAGDDRHLTRIDRVPVVRTWPSVGRRRLTKWLFLPAAAIAAVRLSRHVDVYFCPDLRGVGLAALAAGWWTGKRVVLQGATPGAFSAAHWSDSAAALPVPVPALTLNWARRWLFAAHRRADAVTCITKEHMAEARASGILSERIHYVPHGVDMARFHPATPAERRALANDLGWRGSPIVLFLGRVSREKGVLELLQAWKDVTAKRPDARLVIVGPDVPGHSLDAGSDARTFAQAHGLASVTFAGATDDPAAAIRASDVLVQPSHYEAFPITVIEAMAAGLPVVASFVGGVRDYLRSDENGVAVPPQQPAPLAAALTRVLADEALRIRLGQAGRETVRAQFSREVNLERYAEIFDRLLPA